MRIRTAIAASGLAATAVLGGATAASADSGAQGSAANSPGVLSGNVVQVPIQVPINLCGNTIDIVGLLNPAFGNTCVND
ncbi:chaplin [Streptomyces albus subsp. chlorinus]|uniref:chaplin n=1 Tax=Streptomyces albus TaxID=1888 RepID=UPI00156DAF77|nr:chaplin [Streptomyces albus]NSC24868.1 chaplin [Streptomyces albus subsp. chlorinus]